MTVGIFSGLRERLAGPFYQVNIAEIVNAVSEKPDEMDNIYCLMDDKEQKVAWRAAWICEKLSELHPEWFIPKQNDLLERLFSCQHDGTKRILLSTLYNLPNPEPYSVPFLDYTLDHMLDPKESIAVQASCIKLAYRLCRIDPDLLDELKLRLESVDQHLYSAGVKSAIKNVLKKI
ncbi:hypothetical protein LJB84_03025 [Bacteroidales bacterium OttesenSCG-928-J19]|nr:hypothetical protein [Bacteroidales bacterium OttesenSCG-928-J19]